MVEVGCLAYIYMAAEPGVSIGAKELCDEAAPTYQSQLPFS